MDKIILEKKKRSGNTIGIRVSSEFAAYLAELSDDTGYTVVELSSIFVPYLKRAVEIKDAAVKTKGDTDNA